jgi:hypothetical protein
MEDGMTRAALLCFLLAGCATVPPDPSAPPPAPPMSQIQTPTIGDHIGNWLGIIGGAALSLL